MKISRRGFISIGGTALCGATGLLLSGPAFGQKSVGGIGPLPSVAASDPLLFLTSADFKNHLGTKFTLITDKGKVSVRLADVTETIPAKISARGRRLSRRQPIAESFSLSFDHSDAAFAQSTYRMRHASLGEFDMFLVPEAGSVSRLHAVVNRV